MTQLQTVFVIGTWDFSVQAVKHAAEALRSSVTNTTSVKSVSSHSGHSESRVHLDLDVTPVTEAVIDAIRLIELDPEVHTAGCYSYPTRSGELQLDAGIIEVVENSTSDPPQHLSRAGAVFALEGYRGAIEGAAAVMAFSEHTQLAGDGATQFLASVGLEPSREPIPVVNVIAARRPSASSAAPHPPSHIPTPPAPPLPPTKPASPTEMPHAPAVIPSGPPPSANAALADGVEARHPHDTALPTAALVARARTPTSTRWRTSTKRSVCAPDTPFHLFASRNRRDINFA